MLWRGTAERSLDRIPVEDRAALLHALVDGRDALNGVVLATPRPRLRVRLVHEHPTDSGLESLGIAKAPDALPGRDEGVLERVLGEPRVAQDPVCDGIEPVADVVGQR